MTVSSSPDSSSPFPNRCSQCGAEKDAGELVCPQCGAGLKEQAERKLKAETMKEHKSPPIDVPVHASGSVRRLYIRGKMQRKAIAPRWFPPWLARFLLLANVRPEPPSARRVAVRALVLAAVGARANMALHRVDSPISVAGYAQPFEWLCSLGVAAELESPEHAFMQQSDGGLDDRSLTSAGGRIEGAATLLWALCRFALPAYDTPVDPLDSVLECVGFGKPKVARELHDSAKLRSSLEIDRFASHATIISWRLRQFSLQPGPMDLVAFLQAFSSFKETWPSATSPSPRRNPIWCNASTARLSSGTSQPTGCKETIWFIRKWIQQLCCRPVEESHRYVCLQPVHKPNIRRAISRIKKASEHERQFLLRRRLNPSWWSAPDCR
jgi:hypothetical protein